MELLLAFEIFINKLVFNSRIRHPCIIPAVAFRLPGYPNIIIYQSDPKTTERLVKKLRSIDDITERNELLQSALITSNSNCSYEFETGKSCLIKVNMESLMALLTSVPLYLMLINLYSNSPQLVASGTILLSRFWKEIESREIKGNSAFNSMDSVQLNDLCGKHIADLNLSIKLILQQDENISLVDRSFSHIDVDVTTKSSEYINQRVQTSNCSPASTYDANVPNPKTTEVDENSSSAANQAPSSNIISHCDAERMCDLEDSELYGVIGSVSPDRQPNVICPPPLFFNAHLPLIEAENYTGLIGENITRQKPESESVCQCVNANVLARVLNLCEKQHLCMLQNHTMLNYTIERVSKIDTIIDKLDDVKCNCNIKKQGHPQKNLQANNQTIKQRKMKNVSLSDNKLSFHCNFCGVNHYSSK